MTSVLFPDPDTPVTQVMVPSGIVDVDAPQIVARARRARPSAHPVPRRRCDGTGIDAAPAR